MDTGIEVTDPRRAAASVAIAVAALLVLTLAIVVLLVRPVLTRVDMTLQTLNSSLPILEELGPDVNALRQDVEGVAPDVATIEGTLTGVEDGLGAIDASVRGLRGPLEALSAVLEELVPPAPASATIGDQTAASARPGHLADALDRLTALLEETEQHVENIDRKTGPAPPAGSRPVS